MTTSDPSADAHTWQRLDGIDLLRGLSIFFVLMNHVNMRLLSAHVPYTKGLPSQLIDSLVWNGQFGVQIFFVISGYLIMSTSLRRWGSPAVLNVREFYLLRVARIAPLLLLLLAILSALHFLHVPEYRVSAKTGGLGRALVAALAFHINYLEATRGYLPGNWDILWSLSVEETFYLFFPLVARLFRKQRYLLIPLIALVAAGPFARMKVFNPNPVWREYSYLGGMDGIALGCLTAMLLSRKKPLPGWMRAVHCLGIALLVFSLCFSDTAYHLGLGRNGLNMTILALGICGVICGVAERDWTAPRILKPLLVLGQRSYEIYLTHMFSVLLLFAAFLKFGKPMHGVPVLFLTAIAAAGIVGWLVAKFFAEPVNLQLRKRFGVSRSHLAAAQPEVD
jgi:peptidoglycan/LPS O-acetylase OafA/YrhL